MKRYSQTFIFFISVFVTLPVCAFDWVSIFGKASEDIKLVGGTYFVHLSEIYDKNDAHTYQGDHYRPMIGATYKGYMLAYFKNSHQNDTLSLVFERYWYEKQKTKQRLNIGYRLGLIYGYCGYFRHNHNSFYQSCNSDSNRMVLPMGQVFMDYSINHLGVEIGANPVFINSAIFWRF